VVPQVLSKQAQNQQNKECRDYSTDSTPRGGIPKGFCSGEGETRKFFDEVCHKHWIYLGMRDFRW
jgi:hypothetical protein